MSNNAHESTEESEGIWIIAVSFQEQVEQEHSSQDMFCMQAMDKSMRPKHGGKCMYTEERSRAGEVGKWFTWGEGWDQILIQYSRGFYLPKWNVSADISRRLCHQSAPIKWHTLDVTVACGGFVSWQAQSYLYSNLIKAQSRLREKINCFIFGQPNLISCCLWCCFYTYCEFA